MNNSQMKEINIQLRNHLKCQIAKEFGHITVFDCLDRKASGYRVYRNDTLDNLKYQVDINIHKRVTTVLLISV